MSAEDEKQNETPGDTPAEPAAEAAKKPSRARKASAKAEATEEGKAQEPTAKKPAKARRIKKAAPTPDEEAAAEPVAEEAASESKPAVATKRRPAERRQVVRARARYVRTSARKARMVCGHIRGKSVQEARAILAFTPRDAARDWSKLLESAVANAENNHELLEDDLIVREAYADEGPTIKRFRPRAMGRATPIRKRTSHLTITLTPRS
jgi:ribosomal protein L22